MSNEHPYIIGKIYLVRTATYATCGRLKAVFPGELVFSDAAWVADTGRFTQAVASGVFAEVEPVTTGDIIVSRGGIIDVVETPATLPLQQK